MQAEFDAFVKHEFALQAEALVRVARAAKAEGTGAGRVAIVEGGGDGEGGPVHIRRAADVAAAVVAVDADWAVEAGIIVGITATGVGQEAIGGDGSEELAGTEGRDAGKLPVGEKLRLERQAVYKEGVDDVAGVDLLGLFGAPVVGAAGTGVVTERFSEGVVVLKTRPLERRLFNVAWREL